MTSAQDDGPVPGTWARPSADGTPPPVPPPPRPPAPPGGAAGWGAPPAPPGWGAAPAPGTPAAQAPAGWGAPPPGAPPWQAPAAQPGIIPLRPLGLGEILDGAVRAVRANPAVMFGLSAVVVTVAVALQTAVSLYVTSLLGAALGDVSLEDGTSPTDAAVISEFMSAGGGQALTGPLLVPVTSVLTGLLIVSVSRSVLGQRVAVREVWRTRRVWLLVGFGLLQVLAAALALGLWVGIIALLAGTGTSAAWTVAVAVVSGLALIAASVWVTARTLLVPPALMLEGKRFWPTVARAWRLTRGSFWRLLGIYLLANLLVYVLMYLFLFPASMGAALASFATGSDDLTVLVSAIGQVVGMTLSTTFLAAVVALLYVDVRMRREGLDLELARAATGTA
ncbi:conserved hypothetical protein [Cellulomonas flavigena DSM 20109]|uniref:Glycerophosphoryl diester phosphodiesterase membrane domain-containing protein n=1 Tax=Cellulomonas flavigena (strain ATCC 482 / DSM 20109 / BCRC 11376 / JCM 18109 / NBRC 3775 / NCIMB 8073 / NRS 134) TaxID=446466 RepID=D5UGX5_CELFN|nr:hypothetical protein [Cellulomonas flavigena]ADG75223.1 conserved hypothetical protein [Cellulomonas flavigena DSM 20109]